MVVTLVAPSLQYRRLIAGTDEDAVMAGTIAVTVPQRLNSKGWLETPQLSETRIRCIHKLLTKKTKPKDIIIYRFAGFDSAGKDAFNKLVPPSPFCFPIPSFVRTSFTSPCPTLFAFLEGVRLSGAIASPPVIVEARSKVDTMEDGRPRLGLDIAARPSRASRRSITPSPRMGRDCRLCIDMLSICISAGEILRRGDRLSPRMVGS